MTRLAGAAAVPKAKGVARNRREVATWRVTEFLHSFFFKKSFCIEKNTGRNAAIRHTRGEEHGRLPGPATFRDSVAASVLFFFFF